MTSWGYNRKFRNDRARGCTLNFKVSRDLPTKNVNPQRLRQEIQAAASVELEEVAVTDDQLTIRFKNEPTDKDKRNACRAINLHGIA
jgi:hypothetical protein